MKQLTHQETENSIKEFPLVIICDGIRTPENIGMCFRIADSFGVEKVYLSDDSVEVDNRKVKKTARNTIHEIEHENYVDFGALISNLENNDFAIIGLEITDDSTNIQEYNFNKHEKIGLVIGNERNGISNVRLLNKTVAIPMFGANSSMNVVNSLAIALYEITNQFNLK